MLLVLLRDSVPCQALAHPCIKAAILADEQVIWLPADNPSAYDAFLSILFAPQASAGSFDEMLRSIQQHGLPILLVYGREDPWVRTIWGQRIVRIVPQATFYQVTDPASRQFQSAHDLSQHEHCPSHTLCEDFPAPCSFRLYLPGSYMTYCL